MRQLQKNTLLGMKMLYWNFFEGVVGGGVGENSTKKVRLRVSTEKMKICSYVQVEKIPYLQDVS